MGNILLFNPDDSLDDDLWDRIFQISAWEDLPIIINSQSENTWQQVGFKAAGEVFLEKAIYYAERQNTRLYVLNVSTQEEIRLIQNARAKSLLIYAETTLAHLSRKDFLWKR